MRSNLSVLGRIAWWIALVVFTVIFSLGVSGMVGALVHNEKTLFWPGARGFLGGLMGLALLVYIKRRINE